MGEKWDRFKKAFGYVSEDLYEVRREKSRAALADLEKSLAYLKKQNVQGIEPLEKQCTQLQMALSQADAAKGKGGKDNVKKAYEALEIVKEKSRELAKQALTLEKKTPSKVKLEDGSEASVFPADIPGFHDMDDKQKSEIVAKVTGKISEGKKVMQLLKDDPTALDDLGTSREAISNVMWYLKAKAEEKLGEPYERGAMTLPDPGNKLREMFDRSSKVYGRDSSHLKKHQEQTGGQARGIDFYDGTTEDGDIANTDLLLPAGMRTVLLQSVKLDTGEERLYVKMETESARWNPFFTKRGDTPEPRALEPGDRKNAMLHLGNLIKAKLHLSQGEDKSLKATREKMPDNLKKAYEKLLKAAKKGSPAAHKVLKSGAYKDHIHQMVQNVNEVYALFDEEEIVVDDATLGEMCEVVNEIGDTVQESIGDQLSRIGGEVVLSKDDV